MDRLGFTKSYAYDAVRRRTAETNALGRATLYNYCTCGALESIQDAAGNYTSFTYDNAGRRIQSGLSRRLHGQLQLRPAGPAHHHHRQRRRQRDQLVQQPGPALRRARMPAACAPLLAFDVEDRVTNRWDANGAQHRHDL